MLGITLPIARIVKAVAVRWQGLVLRSEEGSIQRY